MAESDQPIIRDRSDLYGEADLYTVPQEYSKKFENLDDRYLEIVRKVIRQNEDIELRRADPLDSPLAQLNQYFT